MAYTTIEQSKRLVGIGLDPETADATNHDTPAWTLDRLIELLPKELYNVSPRSHYYKLHLFWGEWRGHRQRPLYQRRARGIPSTLRRTRPVRTL